MLQKITPHLWFDHQAEEAVSFYLGIFKDARIKRVSHFGKEGFEIHGRPAGSVMTIEFELEGQEFLALNGGPQFQFNEAVSFVIHCDSQAEIDSYWQRLSAGGNEKAQQCGWLKDKYGLSWQVVPTALPDWLSDHNDVRTQRVMKALLQMKKLDLAALKRAYEE